MLDLIGDLFAAERSVSNPDLGSGDERMKALALRLKMRAEQSRRLENHEESTLQRSTEVAAIFYSLLESAWLCGTRDVSRRGPHVASSPRTRHYHAG